MLNSVGLGICVVCGKSTRYITISEGKVYFVCKRGCKVAYAGN